MVGAGKFGEHGQGKQMIEAIAQAAAGARIDEGGELGDQGLQIDDQGSAG
jgi:hypothetical protein